MLSNGRAALVKSSGFCCEPDLRLAQGSNLLPMFRRSRHRFVLHNQTETVCL